MELKDKLDGITIEVRFGVSKEEGSPRIEGCKAIVSFDGLTLNDVLNRWVRRSVVIDLQTCRKKLSEREIRALFCGNKPYRCHVTNAGKTFESEDARREKHRAYLRTLSDQELKDEYFFTDEQIKKLRNSRK